MKKSLSRVFMKGFTLIELMIVVAIVAILTAIAIPLFNDYKGRSSDASAQADAKAAAATLTLAFRR